MPHALPILAFPESLSSVIQHFLIYINDMPKNVIRSLVNIYAKDTTVFGCASKYVDDW